MPATDVLFRSRAFAQRGTRSCTGSRAVVESRGAVSSRRLPAGLAAFASHPDYKHSQQDYRSCNGEDMDSQGRVHIGQILI